MHFIQQQIAAVGLFDQPAFVFRRPGKRRSGGGQRCDDGSGWRIPRS